MAGLQEIVDSLVLMQTYIVYILEQEKKYTIFIYFTGPKVALRLKYHICKVQQINKHLYKFI